MGSSVFPAPSGAKSLYKQEFTSGTTSWTAPAGVTTIECLLVAGGGAGGGGGTNNSAAGGGGGGGQVNKTYLTVTPVRYYRVNVRRCPESAIFFPNAFTPNGDGLNDGWSPIPFKIVEIKWQVWNRYGQMVYQTNKLGDKWNGIFKNTPQPMSGYVFQCWWRGIDGKTGYKKGNLILIR